MKTGNSIHTLLATLPAFLLTAACTIATAGESGMVRVETSFDNATIHVAQPGERHLEIEVIAPDGRLIEHRERPPMNIALVIDKSGSMAEAGKMRYVKKAARKMIDQLAYGDRFAIVAYDDNVRVLVRSESVEDRRHARDMIDRLYPGGSTNLGAGLLEGYSQVKRHLVPGGINRVLLLSDGLANRGITSPWELSRIVDRESGRGVSLTTFGVGLDFNEDLMASLAESGRGTYYYIDEAHRIPEILAREFSTVQQVVALDITITIEVRPEVTISDFMGYRYRREGNRYTVSLGDMAAGERRRIMIRLNAPALSAGEQRIGEVRMKYQPQGESRSVSAARDLRPRYVRDHAAVEEDLNREVTERSAVFEANDARRKAAMKVDSGDLDGARAILKESRRKLEAAPVQSGQVRNELAETESYQSAIDEPMDRETKSLIQKGVKYKSYRTLQSK
jgi:Ca-activated chloride channel family protein